MPPKKSKTPKKAAKTSTKASAATSAGNKSCRGALDMSFVKSMAATVLSPHVRFEKHPKMHRAAVVVQKPGGVKTGA